MLGDVPHASCVGGVLKIPSVGLLVLPATVLWVMPNHANLHMEKTQLIVMK